MAQALDGHEGLHVDVQEIESALRDLWRREALSRGSPVTRLRTLNLLIMAGEDGGPGLRRALERLPARHPSRVLVLSTSPAASAGAVHSDVAVYSDPEAGEERAASCEVVTLSASPEAAGVLGGAVLPLLIPDLPTFLWWARPGNPVDHPLFMDLSQAADRTIIDTARADPLGIRTLRGVAHLLMQPQIPPIADLNWARIYPWRRLTAQLFDPHDLRRCLGALAAVEADYEDLPGGATGAAQALLYVAWLAGRLGWGPAAARGRGGEREVWFDSPDGDISARMVPVAATGGEGGLARVRLSCPESGSMPQFVIERSADGSSLESLIQVPGGGERRWTTSYRRADQAELLFDELDSRLPDEVFHEALAVIDRLPERIER